MENLTPLKLAIVLILEILFLLVSFIFIGLGFRELKRKKKLFNNLLLIVTGICLAIVSLYCAKVLLFY